MACASRLSAARAVRRGLWPIALALALLAPSALAQPAPPAMDRPVSLLEQRDLDGDGRPDLSVLAASFATASDRVLVYDGAGTMAPSSDWRAATDMRDDTWVFDRAGDGSAQLLLRFAPAADTIRATLYTDQDGDGQVAYVAQGGQLRVTEPGHPPLTAIVEGDWFLPDGRLNWNVRFLTDGPVPHIHTYDLSDFWDRSYIRADGEPDIELRFGDADRDGVPEYGIWRLLAPAPAFEGSVRTWIWANEGRRQPAQPQGYLFWPYLIDRLPNEALREGVATARAARYFDSPPFASVSLNAGSLRLLAFEGYPIEHGFHVHTLSPFQVDRVNYANFENIQAYYDLAADQDGSPELHIRHRYFEQGDPLNSAIPATTNEIRWSWEQWGSAGLSWDFKLGLAGRHEMTTLEQVGDYRFATVPFEDWPAWVLDRPWAYATFMARETAAFQSTEGVYAWAALESLVGDDRDTSALSRYVAGDATIDPALAFQRVDAGWRGEFAPDLAGSPRLYFSPVDRRLHLYRASYGIWQIDAEQQLRSADSDGDGYFDSWAYVEQGGGRRQLHWSPGWLLYGDEAQVVIKQAALRPAAFEAAPPASPSERARLGDLLGAQAGAIDPRRPLTMLEQFAGPAATLTGAAMRDFRPTRGGFRFVLAVQRGAEAGGAVGLAPFAGLAPGEYAISYDGAFTVAPLTPAAPAVTVTAGAPRELEPARLALELRNDGLEDVRGVQLELWATPPGGQPGLLERRRVDLLAGEPASLALSWQPAAAGAWRLEPRLLGADGAVTSFGPTMVVVGRAAPVGGGAILAASSSPALLALLGFGLALAALIAIAGAAQQRRRSL